MRTKGLIIATVLLVRLSSSYSLNITELVDDEFQSPPTHYFRVMQGDSHTIDIYEMTGWEEALQIEGNWPSFCHSESGYQTVYNLNAQQELKDHDPSKPIYKVAVNDQNGVIYGFVYDEGLHALTYSATQNLFTNTRLFPDINQRIYASVIYRSQISNKDWLVMLSDSMLMRYDVSNPDQATHGGSLAVPHGISSLSKVTLLPYASQDLMMFNLGSRIYFINTNTQDTQYMDFTNEVADFAIDLNSMVMYVVVFGGLYQENFYQILSSINDHSLNSFPTRTKSVSTFASYVKEVEARNFTLVVTQDPNTQADQFYGEYYRKSKTSNLVQIRSSAYPLLPQQTLPDFLMMGTNYAIYWVDQAVHVFPIAIKDSLFLDSQFQNDQFEALTFYESPDYQGRMIHVIGEKEDKITVLQIEFATPDLECSPAGEDGERHLMEADEEGKYFFEVRVIGRRCNNLPQTEDPEFVCSRKYKMEMDVLDKTHSGLSRLVASVIIMLSVVIVVVVVVLVIMVIKYKKKKKLADAFGRLPLPNGPPETEEQQEQIEMSDVHLRGFEKAAVRQLQNE